MNGDLHIHTSYSDGELNEHEILKEVINSDIKEFAICDHDTIEGSKKVSQILKNGNYDLLFHSGVEFTTRYNNINMHLLVRDFEYDDENILYLVDKVSKLRMKKIERMVNLVNEVYGVAISKEEINEILSVTKSVGKPHLYLLLSKHGDYDREEYYRNMDSLKSEDLKLDVKEVFFLLSNSKGYVTLAHPIEVMKEYNFTYNDIDNLVDELSVLGLKGLETKHSKQTYEDYLKFSSIAKKYNLIETCGSDYHGEKVKPGIKIGMFEKR